MENQKLNLFEKIQAVSNEVRNISKDMTVGSGSYSYKAVSDIDVTLAVKDAETKFKLVSIPIKQELINSEVVRIQKKNNEEGLTYVDTIKMTVKIIDLEDISQSIEIESFGKGIDSGDKGFGKASTYARKYALLNAYKIATGEDPDANKSTETVTAKTPSEKRVLVENYLLKNVETCQKMLQHFNVGELADITEKDIAVIFKTYTEKKLL
jgi:hypothetical protein